MSLHVRIDWTERHVEDGLPKPEKKEWIRPERLEIDPGLVAGQPLDDDGQIDIGDITFDDDELGMI